MDAPCFESMNSDHCGPGACEDQGTPVARPKYFPYADGRWRLHPGLAPLDPAEWIEIDGQFDEQLALKADLLERRRGAVLVALPESEAACEEVLHRLAVHLPEHFPRRYRRCAGGLEDVQTGRIWRLDGWEDTPLELAARLVQEDLCVLRPRENQYLLAAACVCFPSRWSLREKMGRPLTAIHAPVPGYGAQLSGPVDRLFARLKPEAPQCRLNWTIVETSALHLAPDGPRDMRGIDGLNAGQRLWLRIERQTLRRLDAGNAVLFTIRTHLHPLSTLEGNPPMAAALASTVRQLPKPMQLYKSIEPVREALLAYLDALAVNSAAPSRNRS
jgi:hypothetical protein